MTKFWLVGVAAFALMTGAALAQDTSSETTTTTQSTNGSETGGSSSTQTRQSVDSDGVQTDKSKSYTRDSNGIHARSDTRQVAPDGSERTVSHEQIASPDGSTSTTDTTKSEQ
jgi:hypothetical protein